MVKINQHEAFYLRDMGLGKDVHMSSKTHKGRAKRYFATESPKTMKALKKYRQDIIVK